jgi:hypothetical protein
MHGAKVAQYNHTLGNAKSCRQKHSRVEEKRLHCFFASSTLHADTEYCSTSGMTVCFLILHRAELGSVPQAKVLRKAPNVGRWQAEQHTPALKMRALSAQQYVDEGMHTIITVPLYGGPVDTFACMKGSGHAIMTGQAADASLKAGSEAQAADRRTEMEDYVVTTT